MYEQCMNHFSMGGLQTWTVYRIQIEDWSIFAHIQCISVAPMQHLHTALTPRVTILIQPLCKQPACYVFNVVSPSDSHSKLIMEKLGIFH